MTSAEQIDDLVYQAKLAEQAERYEEMVGKMKEVAVSVKTLGLEERNLLSVAYKNVVGARRASLRIISSIEAKEKTRPDSQYIEIIQAYRVSVVQELENVCNDILDLLTQKPRLIE